MIDILSWIFILLFAGLWIFLLFDFIRRRRFYPVFSTNQRTRIFWLCTFLLMNPLLVLLYWKYGRRANPDSPPSRKITALLLLITLAVLAFHFAPWFEPGAEKVFFTRNINTGKWTRKGPLSVESSARLAWTFHEINTFTGTGFYGNNEYPLSCRRVAIFAESSHPLIRRTGLAVQKQFMELPFVQEVDYYPEDQLPAAGSLAYDLYVILKKRSGWTLDLPFYRFNAVELSVYAGRSPSQIAGSWQSQNHPPPVISFIQTLSFKGTFRTIGFESSGTRYCQEEKAATEKITKKLFESMNKWQAQQGLLPVLPSSCYGPYRPPEPFNLSVEPRFRLRNSTYGLLNHCDADYIFDDVRDVTAVINEVKAEMESQGWNVGIEKTDEGPTTCLRAQRGKRYLYVFREPPSGFTTMTMAREQRNLSNERPYIAHYVDAFTNEEIQKIVDDMLADGTDLTTVSLFNYWLTAEQRRYLQKAGERWKPATINGWIRKARFLQGSADPEAASQAFQNARAIAAGECSAMSDADFAEFARYFRVESWAEEVLDATDYQSAGYINLNNHEDAIERDLSLDEPLRLFILKSDRSIHTAMICVIRNPENKSGIPYAIDCAESGNGIKVRTTTHGSEIGANGLRVFPLPLPLDKIGATATIQEIEPGRFRVLVKKNP